MKKLIYLLLTLILIGCSIEGVQAPIMGLDGKDGIDGVDGQDGQDGVDGVDGTDGVSTYLEIQENSPEEGQTTIISWTDYNGDKILNEGEINDVVIINDGEDGEDGVSSDIKVTIIEPGETCENGGVLVTVTKSTGEVTETVICCCACEEEEKVNLCHYDQEKGYIDIFVPASEVQEHINHGDYLGTCKDMINED